VLAVDKQSGKDFKRVQYQLLKADITVKDLKQMEPILLTV
jgi:hypothetical protein